MDKLREALKKDFRKLYVRQYTADWETKRLVRELEIDIMALEHTAALFEETRNQLRAALEQSRKGEPIDLSEEWFELFSAIQNDAIARVHSIVQVLKETDK